MNGSSAAALLARARDLLTRTPLVDGHNDFAFVVWSDREARGDVAVFGPERHLPRYDTDIPRLREGGVGAQVFAAFLPTSVNDPFRSRLEVIDVVLQLEQRYPETFLPARRAEDVIRAAAGNRIASIIAIESTVGMGEDLWQLRLWHALGVRLITLCHNETLDCLDSATDAPRHHGLGPTGRPIIAAMNRLGLIVDLAHASEAAQLAAIEASEAPVVISHANARTLCPHPRNATDAVLDALAARDGLIMATFVPAFLSRASYEWLLPLYDGHGKLRGGEAARALREREAAAGPWPKSSLFDVADHIEYIANRIGIDHVGIGSDFYGGPVPVGLEDVSCFPSLLAELIRRGWGDDALVKLAGGNFLRVWRAVEVVASRAGQPAPANVPGAGAAGG